MSFDCKYHYKVVDSQGVISKFVNLPQLSKKYPVYGTFKLDMAMEDYKIKITEIEEDIPNGYIVHNFILKTYDYFKDLSGVCGFMGIKDGTIEDVQKHIDSTMTLFNFYHIHNDKREDAIYERWAKARANVKPPSKFKVGARVKVKNCFDGNDLNGMSGKIIHIYDDGIYVDVEFDYPFRGGNDANGRGADEHCYSGYIRELELI